MMLGQLQDTGDTTALARYLDLLWHGGQALPTYFESCVIAACRTCQQIFAVC